MSKGIYIEDAISRADLIKELRKDAERVEMEEFANDTVWRTIGNAPSVIPSRPQGEWIPDPDGGFKCSNCRAEEDEFIYGTGMRYVNGESEFCPNCGAKMKGADNERP